MNKIKEVQLIELGNKESGFEGSTVSSSGSSGFSLEEKQILPHEKYQLYRFEDIPDYLKDNPYIQAKYRAYYTYREAFASLFRIHNETGNIWTHLAGFLVVLLLILPIQYSFFLPQEASVWDRVIFALYLLSAAKCLLCSSLFHLFIGCSRDAFKKWGCWDYSGISTLICGCYCIVVYYCFYCETLMRNIFLGVIFAVNFTGIIGPQTSAWSEPWFRLFRAGIYLVCGVVSTVPILYWLGKYGVPSTMELGNATNVLGIGWGSLFALEMCIWLAGVAVYAWRFPECYLPGKCDILFHSHQIWHTLIVLGVLVHYQLSLQLLKWRLSGVPGGGCPVRSSLLAG
ncbi:inc metabolism membrane protein [Basidiobolus ranarum]|uniref:Inc metabolism membrane protein n=1 Tax=Basidiobolus ranarum TaxID=34480 RepID=A0ABR2W327_9FUNG